MTGQAIERLGSRPQDAKTCRSPDGAAATVHRALGVIEGRWKLLIIFRLFEDPVLRFSELDRRIPGLSQKVLVQQLRQLEKDGVIRRIVHGAAPHRVEYQLSEAGQELYDALKALLVWAEHLPS